MATATNSTVTTTTAPLFGTETPALLNRNDLVAIVNALLLFAAEHCSRNSKPRILITWNTRGVFKEVAFYWALEKFTQCRDMDLHHWGEQCHNLKQYLGLRYEALAMRLNDAWTESRAIITRAKNTEDLQDSPTPMLLGRLNGEDLCLKINCLLDFAARVCKKECEPKIQVLWTSLRAKKRILLFWSLKHVQAADDEYYQSHHKAQTLRECLAPDFYARVSYNDDVSEARASIINVLAVNDSREE